MRAEENISFREDAPRPPVPGEEGRTPCQLPSQRPSNPRRNQDGLGEPEGSASPDSPLVRWTKSLHSLLGDQDGAHLFRTFLEREKCVDTLDFWFACNGFRQMDLRDTKTLRVAKAIHKRYIENLSVVAKQLKVATKTFIRDCIKRQQIGSTMFDQAQAEIQSLMEDHSYQTFLTSDIYLEYVRTGGENSAYLQTMGPGSLKLVNGYLPTLNEEEELICLDIRGSPTVVGLSSRSLRATASSRAQDTMDICYRSSDPADPYHVTSAYVLAPAASTNDSEFSSDARTDDSMTDSS
ncbi:axin-2-like, partial [Anomaloglossus baeobatrachus]|uniref:axin-2-like n=1 Tax=Anomaloglossus baeobatrachus TaxID=238106 RepID=UPI003F502D24